MKRLPPLTAIEAFVQVARLGSVKAAAGRSRCPRPRCPAGSRRSSACRPSPVRAAPPGGPPQPGRRAAAGRDRARRSTPWRAMERAAGQRELMRLKLAVLPLFASYRPMPRLGAPRQPTPIFISTSTPAHTLSPGSTKGSMRRSRSPARSIPRSTASSWAPIGWSRSAATAAFGAHPSGPARRGDRAPAPRFARRLRLLARGGRPARPAAGGDRLFRFRPAHPRCRRAGPRHRLHVRDAPRRRARSAPPPPVRPRRRQPLRLLVRLPPLGAGRRPLRIFHDWLVGEVVEARCNGPDRRSQRKSYPRAAA